jgi:YidC/Oxa1 family membrane protein insertase
MFRDTGLSVICVSIAVSFLCLPLYAVAEKWQKYERDLQGKFKPKIDKIKAVFSGDEQYMILAAFYRQNHYHPIYSMRSSFGLLIQIPFFIAAYSYLSSLDLLNGAAFLFFNNLGEPDGLLRVGNFSLNLLPVLMTAVNCAAGAIYTKGFPLKEKVQLYGMAAVFLVLLYASPSGLVIYWIMNNVFSLFKNIYYKITFKFKNALILGLYSILCFFFSFYVLFLYRGDTDLKNILAAILVFAGIAPWVLGGLNKYIKKISFPAFSDKDIFLLFLVSVVSLWIITGLFLPSMLIGSSPQEFSFIDDYTTPLYFIYNASLQSLGLFLFWPFCLYFLFSQKVRKYFAFAGFVILISAVVNIFLFPGNYGIISVELVFDDDVGHNSLEIIKNIFILAIPAIIVGIVYFFNRLKILAVAAALCLFSFSGMSLYNMVNINGEFHKVRSFRDRPGVGRDGVSPVFNLSRTGKNVVVIMLDMAQGAFVPFILEESPDLKEIYSGFVYYPNTVSFHGRTRIGAPPLLGGYEYTPSEFNRRDTVPVVTKHNEALLLMPRIFSEAGFEVTVTDPPYPNYSSKDDLRIYDEYPGINAILTDSQYTGIWMEEHDLKFQSTGAIIKRNLFWYSLFKILPLAFRKGIYLQGDWCAPSLAQKAVLTLNGYSVLDYLPRLTGFSPQKDNTALIMINNTTHNHSFLEAPEYIPTTAVSNYGTSPYRREIAYHTNIAALKRLGDWFGFLKANDVYDNTKIILVSDHGSLQNYVNNIKLPFNLDNFNPLLMVKDFNASGGLKTDDSFMTNADVPFLAFGNIIDNPVNPFTGAKISNEAKKHPLYIAISGSLHLESPDTTQFTLDPKMDYYVHDNIFDPANWIKAEQ